LGREHLLLQIQQHLIGTVNTDQTNARKLEIDDDIDGK